MVPVQQTTTTMPSFASAPANPNPNPVLVSAPYNPHSGPIPGHFVEVKPQPQPQYTANSEDTMPVSENNEVNDNRESDQTRWDRCSKSTWMDCE